VLAVSFNLSIFNDLGLLTPPPLMPFAVGMDVLLETRAMNHLKKLKMRQCSMSPAFVTLASAWDYIDCPPSDGEWVPPPSDLGLLGLPPQVEFELDSGDKGDSEAETAREHKAAMDFKRPRASNTRWAGRVRQQ
jgi:hypothetical protein